MRKLTVFPALLLVAFANAQVKPTPASERMKSVEQRAALEQKSVVNDVSFRNIGPTVMSGRVVDIEVNFADPTEFYVAYATGGSVHTMEEDLTNIATIGEGKSFKLAGMKFKMTGGRFVQI